MMNIWLFVPAPIRRALAWIGGAIAVAWGFYQAGRNAAHADRDKDELKANLDAVERINNADIGIGASDSERIDRLREYANKHGRD